MKLTKLEKAVFAYVGEVAVVFDSNFKLIRSHPFCDEIMSESENDHVPGLRAWFNLGKLGGVTRGFRSGEYEIIFTRGADDPCMYDGDDYTPESLDLITQCLVAGVIEDTSAWGQAAFEEPFLTVAKGVAEAANSYRLNIQFSPDCGICYNGNVLGFST
jgi:hypothetical protein